MFAMSQLSEFTCNCKSFTWPSERLHDGRTWAYPTTNKEIWTLYLSISGYDKLVYTIL